ncbi:MAG: hypothetical protein HQ526_00715, partial [Actinobacteria bacterium]|nr:hypothetical protein [Actinomycetota bacterium]
GVAVISTILATQFASRLQPTLDQLPAVVPDEAKKIAGESVGGAVAVFGRAGEAGLPPSIVESSTAAAFESFLSASHITAYVSATMVLIAGIVMVSMLPKITPPTKDPVASPAPHDPDTVHELTGKTEAEAEADAAELEDSYSEEAAAEIVDRPPPKT